MAYVNPYSLAKPYMFSGVAQSLLLYKDVLIDCGLVVPGENADMLKLYTSNKMSIERGTGAGAVLRTGMTSDELASFKRVPQTIVSSQLVQIEATPEAGDTSLVGEILDRRKVENFLSTENSANSLNFLKARISAQTTSVYRKYMAEFFNRIFADNYIKDDYTSTGDDGTAVTFDADVGLGGTISVDLTTSTNPAMEWRTFIGELNDIAVDIIAVCPEGLIYMPLPDKVFYELRWRCDMAKNSTSHARSGEAMLDGSKSMIGSNYFTDGRYVFFNFPYLPLVGGLAVDADSTRSLLLTRDSIRVGVVSTPVSQSINISGGTTDAVTTAKGTTSFTALVSAALGQQAGFTKRFDDMLSSELQRSMMLGGGPDELWSAIGSSLERKEASTDATSSKGYLLQTSMQFGVVRAQNLAMKEVRFAAAKIPAARKSKTANMQATLEATAQNQALPKRGSQNSLPASVVD